MEEDVNSYAWNRAAIWVGAAEVAAENAARSGTENGLDGDTAYGRLLVDLRAYEPRSDWGPDAVSQSGRTVDGLASIVRELRAHGHGLPKIRDVLYQRHQNILASR